MKKLEYIVRFNTPAFLGNAEQQGQWRTPPLKALLRQWWRVAYAQAHGYLQTTAAMRQEEGLLFGHAWLESDRDKQGHAVAARKSAIRIRLDNWGIGKLKNWEGPDQTVRHPEVKNHQGEVVPVGSNLYLGYGPLVFRNGTALKSNAAIQAGESATLSIAVPEEHAQHIQHAILLMDRYGTLGGRSRNGWGSFALHPLPPGEGWGEGTTLADAIPLRPWRDCLALDWPHAIGADDVSKPLIWQTRPFDDWKGLMRELAIVKIGLRTQFNFPNVQPPHPQPLDRHWLSYPITRHSTRAFDRNARLPNSLRFKVRTLPDGKLVGVIFHVPCLPPPAFNPDSHVVENVWQRVHAFLDTPVQQLARIPA